MQEHAEILVAPAGKLICERHCGGYCASFDPFVVRVSVWRALEVLLGDAPVIVFTECEVRDTRCEWDLHELYRESRVVEHEPSRAIRHFYSASHDFLRLLSRGVIRTGAKEFMDDYVAMVDMYNECAEVSEISRRDLEEAQEYGEDDYGIGYPVITLAEVFEAKRMLMLDGR